jgi:hypothetical protein
MIKREGLPRLLGEFAVIVVGVFVALAGESWYQSWSEGRGLEGYLDRLELDLQADSTTYDFILGALDLKDEAMAMTADVASGVAEPDSAFFERFAITTSMGFQTPGTQRPTYDDMLATGNLRLIQDDVLRSRIVAYYDEIETQWNRIDQRRTGYSQMVYRLNPSSWEEGVPARVSERMRLQAIDSLRTFRFMNLLGAERRLSSFQRDRAGDALVLVMELLAAVRLARASL